MKQAFSLIELLVVISITAVLAALLLPAIQMVRQAAWTAVCMSNSRQLSLGILSYASDWKGFCVSPWNTASNPRAGWHGRIAEYFNDGSLTVFWCPGNRLRRPDAVIGMMDVPTDGGVVSRPRRADYALSIANGDYWASGHGRDRAITWIDGTWVNTQQIWSTAGSRRLSACAADTALFFECQDRPDTWTAYDGGESSFANWVGRLRDGHKGRNSVARVDGAVAMMSARETLGADPNQVRGVWTIQPGD